MRKNEKKSIFSKFPPCPIFKFFVVTREVICQKMAPILDPVNFFSVLTLLDDCDHSGPPQLYVSKGLLKVKVFFLEKD